MSQSEKENFDYIIVGAGSSGCVLAARLSEDPNVSVLLLEAGGGDNSPQIKMPLAFLQAMLNPKYTWGYFSEPEPTLNGRRLWVPRGKVLGGSSSINGTFYMRGHPRDYDQWAQLGATGWSYEGVLPYFKRLENSWRGGNNYHGDVGPVEVTPIKSRYHHHEALMNTAEKAGYPVSSDLAGEQADGFARGETTIDRAGRRVSAATAYLKPNLQRANLTVRTHAHTRKVLFKDRKAIGVAYKHGDIEKTAFSRREVILSGGAYNSPQLLLLSGVGPADHLQEMGIDVVSNSPGVGRNLSEHANVWIEFAAKKNNTFLTQLRADKVAFSTLRWMFTGKGPLSTLINSSNIVIKTDTAFERPDIQIMANPVRMDAKIWFPGFGKKQEHVFSAGVVGLHPHSRGWVKLKSPEAFDHPAITLNLLSTDEDYAMMRRGIRAARKIYATPPQSELLEKEIRPGVNIDSDDELNAYIRETVELAQHPVGTCSMGAHPEAVVDPQLRVIGVKGLRVVDASVMPTVPGGNTSVPCMMIGEKAAEMIKDCRN